MKKSKFLKKSLAMLLALMLVVAMIPLSAAAAEGDPTIYVDNNLATLNLSLIHIWTLAAINTNYLFFCRLSRRLHNDTTAFRKLQPLF